MSLHYLDFDFSEDAEGTGTFDAMACVTPAHAPKVHDEIARVLHWAHTRFAGRMAPLEEDGAWHYDLQEAQEAGDSRITITFTVSGNADFCATLREAFGLLD